MAPDVNVLVAAFRDDHVHHAAARAWLSEALANCATGGSLQVLPMVAASFVRLVTNPKVFRITVEARAAFAFLDRLLAVPGVTMPALGPEWPIFRTLCIESSLAGGATTDGWIAAAIKANGLKLVTFDSDFGSLLEPYECLRLVAAPGVQEKRPGYVVRRMARGDPSLRSG